MSENISQEVQNPKNDEFIIQTVVFLNDIARLPKSNLEEICTDLDLPAEGTAEDLTSIIWSKIQTDKSKIVRVLDAYKGRILGGKTSVAWYKITSGASLAGSKAKIIEKLGFNPFKKCKIPPVEELTSTPVIVNAANGEKQGEYFLRFMFKSKSIRSFYANTLTPIQRSKIVTAFIDENAGCIEIRTDNINVKKVAAAFARLIGQEITIEQVNIAKKFGNNIEAIAKSLNGNIIGASSKSELQSDDKLTDDEAEAIVDILRVIDGFLSDDCDADCLAVQMQKIKDDNTNLLSSTKFIALILSGLGKVGLDASKLDLKESPLYEVLKPYVINQEGNIFFTVNEDGVSNDYTAKVGFTTNSIYFTAPATEKAIKFVRDSIIFNKESK